MKFKLSIVLFNILILSALAMVFAVPAGILGADLAREIWRRLWFLPLVLLVLLVGIDLFFIINRRFYLLLEEERWPELLDYLEEQFYQKSGGKRGIRLNRFRVRIFISVCFLSGFSNRLERLEGFLRKEQPEMFRDYFLSLGLTRLLKNDPDLLEEYYKDVFALGKIKDSGWCIWLYCFALLLQKKNSQAHSLLLELTKENDPLLRLVSLYLFSTIAGAGDFSKEELETRRDVLRGQLRPRRFKALKEKDTGNLLFYALAQFIDQAYQWLNEESAASL